MMLHSNRVLIVDDEFIITETLRIYVEDMGLEVCGTAATADSALAMALEHQPYLVLMDVRLQGERDGIQASEDICQQVGSKVIFITGSREPATLERIENRHPAAVLFKPVSEGQLGSAVQKVLKEAPSTQV